MVRLVGVGTGVEGRGETRAGQVRGGTLRGVSRDSHSDTARGGPEREVWKREQVGQGWGAQVSVLSQQAGLLSRTWAGGGDREDKERCPDQTGRSGPA